MSLGIISIKTTAVRFASTRPTSIKLTSTGDSPINRVSLYDANGVGISNLYGLVSGVEYEIMTGVQSSSTRPEFLIPAPIYRIDFYTELTATPLLKVTNIQCGLRVTDAAGRLILKEVNDSRVTGYAGDPIVIGGGIARVFTTAEDAMPIGMSFGGGGSGVGDSYTKQEVASINNIGDYYPAFGINTSAQRLDYGVVNTEIGLSLRGGV